MVAVPSLAVDVAVASAADNCTTLFRGVPARAFSDADKDDDLFVVVVTRN